MADVVDLEAWRPHLVLACDEGHAHVLPVALALDWAAGIREPDACCVRRIIVEWLACVRAGCVQHAVEDA